MGTNYYTDLNTCPTCKRPEETIHLGKSSGGWWFHFQLNGQRFYKNVAEMREWTKDKEIRDEYGDLWTYDDFWKMVEEKQKNDKRPVEWERQYPTTYINIDGFSFADCEFS